MFLEAHNGPWQHLYSELERQIRGDIRSVKPEYAMRTIDPDADYVPVPARVTVRSPPPPPFTFRVADLTPFVVGLKVTLMAQIA